MVQVTMSMDEYLALLNMQTLDSTMSMSSDNQEIRSATKPRKRSSKYQVAYKKNFKRIAKDFKKKDGSWKKNGFRNAVKKSHESTRKGMVRKTARRAYEKR